MAEDPKRVTPPGGVQRTGYSSGEPAAWPTHKSVIQQLKDVAPAVGVVVVLATVIGSWRDTKSDVASLKTYAEERKQKDAQRDADFEAQKKSSAAAFSSAMATATTAAEQTKKQGDQLKELNRVLRRLNLTQHRAAPPSPDQ